jgi:acetyl esterase/lipase
VGNGEPFYAETCTYIDNLCKVGIEAEMDVYKSDMHAFDMVKPELEISKNAALKFNKHFEYAMEHYFAEN